MKQIEFTTAEREALQYWRFHHPHPRVQRKMEAFYLKSQGLAPAKSVACAPCPNRPAIAISTSTAKAASQNSQRCPFIGARGNWRTTARVLKRTFASVAQPVWPRRPEDCRLDGAWASTDADAAVLKVLGAATPQSGQIPAKADVAAQEVFKTEQLEPRLAEANAGQRVVFFMDAAHFVLPRFWDWWVF